MTRYRWRVGRFYRDFLTFLSPFLLIMNLKIQMVDTDTGELLYNQEKILACQFHRNDTAFNLMHKVLESCVRGIRSNKVNSIELKIHFCEPKIGNSAQLPFNDGVSF